MGCFIETMPEGRTVVLTHGLADEATVYAGNSGTTARLLAGLAAGINATVTIDGDESLRRRPMDRIAEPLAAMGAAVTTSEGGMLPMTIRGGGLKGIRYELPVASAQVKSAILIAGLMADGQTTVVEPVPTRDHTELMLRSLGVDVRVEGNEVTVTGKAHFTGGHISVPGDCSSAAYLAAAAACLPGSEIYMPVTGVNPTRTGFLELLNKMGAEVAMEGVHEMSGEKVADVMVAAAPGGLCGVTLDDPDTVVSCIDEMPILAVVATQAKGETTVRGAGELRVKESDRIASIVGCLSAMGADITELEDGFEVRGPTRLHGAVISPRGDHRIAMAMTIAGLLADGKTKLDDASVVEISYPSFFTDLSTLLR
jgi:3-phosphoshikimate 1-carboxyvinyltransferase